MDQGRGEPKNAEAEDSAAEEENGDAVEDDSEVLPPWKRAKKTPGRRARTLQDLFETPCPDGKWDYLPETKKAIYACSFCFKGKDARANVKEPMIGRIASDLCKIVSKAHDHVATEQHLKRKTEADLMRRVPMAEMWRRMEEEKKSAARLATFTATPLPRLFDSGAADAVMAELPQNVKSFTRCTEYLPKSETMREVYVPAVFSLQLTLLKELVRGQLFSLIVDESKDCIGRPVVNVLCQLGRDGEVLSFLIASRRLEEPANNTNVKSTIDGALIRIGARWEQVLAVASDSAAYMMDVLHETHPDVLHIRCLAHLLHNAVLKGIAASEVATTATELGVNLSRANGTVQRAWSNEVMSRQPQVETVRRVPKHYETRWVSLLTVLEFALEYLPGSVSFVRQTIFTLRCRSFAQDQTRVVCSQC